MSDGVKRRYDSSRRREQAQENQRRVLAAAHDLFVAQGYGATTLTQVAAAAGVAVETVYAAFGTKVGVLHRAWDVAVGGDDRDVHLLERPELRAVFAEPDLATRLTAFATVNTAIMRRTARLLRAVRGAAGADPAAAELLDTIDRARLESLGEHARAAVATGRLAVTEDACRDILFATTDGALWLTLVDRQGWSDEAYAAWLAGIWTASLVR
ncbi:TetR/AcrR family transcriptional regulator [Actinomycetospora chlora]|uniref:TetR/AcrR family transcriptional regulator n=1 Tax=Actinomycetospora chlora TaxID=663608 RepID=A0ABP9CFY9_9PSEU